MLFETMTLIDLNLKQQLAVIGQIYHPGTSKFVTSTEFEVLRNIRSLYKCLPVLATRSRGYKSLPQCLI